MPLRNGHTILYQPAMADVARGIAAHLGTELTMCTTELSEVAAMCSERFPSGDPNIKLRIDLVRDRHVVLLVSQDSSSGVFEQLSVLVFLQRFTVPHALEADAKTKWKKTYTEGRFDVCSAASITVVIPWYSFCQMERTSRWTVQDGKWYNGKAEGEYVDIATAHTFAAILSSTPCEPGAVVPKQVLLLDLHEIADTERNLNASGKWANLKIPYDAVHGAGTYFASAFDHFLANVLLPTLPDLSQSFVVFPDAGAHRRFYTMVQTQACAGPLGASSSPSLPSRTPASVCSISLCTPKWPPTTTGTAAGGVGARAALLPPHTPAYLAPRQPRVSPASAPRQPRESASHRCLTGRAPPDPAAARGVSPVDTLHSEVAHRLGGAADGAPASPSAVCNGM